MGYDTGYKGYVRRVGGREGEEGVEEEG